jgi:hypothetical protein
MVDLSQPNPEPPNSGASSASRPRQDDVNSARIQEGSFERSEEVQPDAEDQTLFPSKECTALEQEWREIQTDFIDSPRTSVERADALVKRTIDTLASSFSEMRSSLERTWEKDQQVSTEDLRMALQQYRSFFRRLLSI